METQESMTQELKTEGTMSQVENTEVKRRGRPKGTSPKKEASFTDVKVDTEALTKKIEALNAEVQKLLTEKKEAPTKETASLTPDIHSIDPQYQRELLKQKFQTLQKKYEKKKEWEEVRGLKLLKMTQVYYEYPPGVHPNYPQGGVEKGCKHSLYIGKATSEQQRKKIRDL